MRGWWRLVPEYVSSSDVMSFRVDTRAATKALNDLNRTFEKATMYGLREAGRKGKQAAKRQTPVLTGELKSSIHTSRRLRKTGPGSFALHIGPWGGKVNLYRNKIEQSSHYMEQAYREAWGKMSEGFLRAYTRVIERAGKA